MSSKIPIFEHDEPADYVFESVVGRNTISRDGRFSTEHGQLLINSVAAGIILEMSPMADSTASQDNHYIFVIGNPYMKMIDGHLHNEAYYAAIQLRDSLPIMFEGVLVSRKLTQNQMSCKLVVLKL